MKHIFILSVILFVSSLVHGQSADEQAIRRHLNTEAQAGKENDYKKIAQLYAEDFVFVAANGKEYTKAERVEHMKEVSGRPIGNFSFQNIRVRIYGNTAVVNTELHLNWQGTEEETHLTTIVLVKRNGQWLEVNSQATKKADK
jgi:uncharacterized protein (TIGR02246 family)